MSEILNLLTAVQAAFVDNLDQGALLTEELDRFIDLIDQVDKSYIHQGTAVEVLGLEYLSSALELAEKNDLFGIVKALRPITHQLNWSRFYEEDEWNRSFINRCANGACVGPLGILKSDDLVLDVFVLGPHTLYPPHGHAAVEIYYILCGNPLFQIDNSPWEEKSAGSFSFHPSNVVHATRTTNEPMLSVIVWRGDIRSPSWHVSDVTFSEEDRIGAKRLW
jgi:hypothetical protein